jgi:hypothetical protein
VKIELSGRELPFVRSGAEKEEDAHLALRSLGDFVVVD